MSGERSSHGDALLQPSRELTGTGVEVSVGELNRLGQPVHASLRHGARHTGKPLHRPGEDPTHGVARVQRRVGVLKHHLDSEDLVSVAR